jgi:hypothetical protein
MSNNGLAHGLNILISISILGVFIGFEWAISFTVYRPYSKAANLNSLHFLSDVIGSELNSLYSTWELNRGLIRPDEAF